MAEFIITSSLNILKVMKTLIIISFFSIAGLFYNLPNLDAITEALSKGDVEALAAYFDESVEIAVLEEEDVYRKADATKVLRTFFSKNKPTKFDQVHKGTSKGQDSVYCIGNLTTSARTYRVYVFMRVDGAKYFIQELRFDEE